MDAFWLYTQGKQFASKWLVFKLNFIVSGPENDFTRFGAKHQVI